jgi:phosphoglycolate phosphatase
MNLDSPRNSDRNSDSRILLWDIDGTLIRSARAGAFKDYTIPILEKVFGSAGRLDELRVSGMTDMQIVLEALAHEGVTIDHINEKIDDLRSVYLSEMERVTASGEQLFFTLPGVRELLEATSIHPRYRNALLTGNIKPAADLKMRLVGLDHFFQLPGAFGDDSHDRRDLPAIAAERIGRFLGTSFQPHQFIVIGDTPNDIACARHFGATAIAVATGRNTPIDLLREHKPDVILTSLEDTAAVLETLGRY